MTLLESINVKHVLSQLLSIPITLITMYQLSDSLNHFKSVLSLVFLVGFIFFFLSSFVAKSLNLSNFLFIRPIVFYMTIITGAFLGFSILNRVIDFFYLDKNKQIKAIEEKVLNMGYKEKFAKKISQESLLSSKIKFTKEIINILDYKNEEKTKAIINEIKQSEKSIIVVNGENGAGKTTLCFKIAKYFSLYRKVLIHSADNYKNTKKIFHQIAEKLNLDHTNIDDIEASKKPRASLYKVLEIFLSSSTNLLIIDISGRNFDNKGLMRELYKMLGQIILFTQKNRILFHSFLIIRPNNIRNYKIDSQYFDGIIINIHNKRFVGPEILDIIETYKEYAFVFTSKDHEYTSLYPFSMNHIMHMLFDKTIMS